MYGRSCAQSRGTLESLVLESTGLPLGSFVETQADAFLCHHCGGNLEKLEKIKAEISRNISALHRIETAEPCHSRQPLAGGKRSSSDGTSNLAKQARMGSVHEQQPTSRQVTLQQDLSLSSSQLLDRSNLGQSPPCGPEESDRHQGLQNPPILFSPEECPLPFSPEPPCSPEQNPLPLGPQQPPLPLGPEQPPLPLSPKQPPLPLSPEQPPLPLRPEQPPLPLGPEPPFSPEQNPNTVSLSCTSEPSAIHPSMEQMPPSHDQDQSSSNVSQKQSPSVTVSLNIFFSLSQTNATWRPDFISVPTCILFAIYYFRDTIFNQPIIIKQHLSDGHTILLKAKVKLNQHLCTSVLGVNDTTNAMYTSVLGVNVSKFWKIGQFV